MHSGLCEQYVVVVGGCGGWGLGGGGGGDGLGGGGGGGGVGSDHTGSLSLMLGEPTGYIYTIRLLLDAVKLRSEVTIQSLGQIPSIRTRPPVARWRKSTQVSAKNDLYSLFLAFSHFQYWK